MRARSQILRRFARQVIRRVVLLSLLATVPLAYGQPTSAPPSTLVEPQTTRQAVRVLFVGNSYTFFHDMPRLVEQIAVSAAWGPRLITDTVVEGGATLELHWRRGEALRRIRSRPWDYVVLQEQSTRPITDPELFYEYARRFGEAIEEADATPILFLTWARENRPNTQPALDDAYRRMAAELGALVAPAGPAWQSAGRQGSAQLYDNDGSHPNRAGAYLTACVLFATLAQQEARRASLPSGIERVGEQLRLSRSEAARLARIAWDTVRTF